MSRNNWSSFSIMMLLTLFLAGLFLVLYPSIQDAVVNRRMGDRQLSGPHESSIRVQLRIILRNSSLCMPAGVSGHFPSRYISTHIRLCS